MRNTVAQPMMTGDRGWLGVNMRLDPSQLAPGYMSGAINARFRNGIAETRLGSTVMAWLNKIVAANVQPWGTVYGAGEFRDPTTFTEYELIAADGNIYLCLQNNAPRALALPAGVTVTSRCTFVQCFNVVICLRGFDADPIAMSDVNVGFTTITQTATGDGTLAIPRALRGVFAANRLFLLRSDDSMVASGLFDYTRYTLFDDFRVNQGDADKGVALAVFGDSGILVFKQRSVYRIDQIYGGDLSSARFSLVTNRYGCVAADSVVNCGSDVLWLSQEGVASVTLTEQNEIQAAQGALAGKNRMFSEPIGPLIDRVNWNFASGAFGALWQDRYYLVLPVDQAELLGPELALGNALTTGSYSIATTIGATYRFDPGLAGNELVNGVDTYTKARTFTAAGATVTLNSATTTSDSSLKLVSIGVNGVMAHYDFQNQAWGGYDEADSIGFKYLFTASYLGKRRLFVLTHDGYVRLWEEGFADRLSQPYVDLAVKTSPVPDGVSTVRVNSGTTVLGNAALVNSGNFWGVSAGTAAANLDMDINGTPGYSSGTAGHWTAPNTFTLAITNGIRFVSTNGVLPSVITTGPAAGGTWATLTYHVEQDIVTTLVTRGYRREDEELIGPGTVNLDVQTWRPKTSVTLLSDGVAEEVALLTDRTRDRTKWYRPFDRVDWVTSNANDDAGDGHRQDYSIEPDSTSYSFTPPVTSEVNGDLQQSARYPFRITGRPRRVLRFEVRNTQGRIRLLNVGLENIGRGRSLAIKE